MKKISGNPYITKENSEIYLNPNLFPIEETLIHEALHILKPELDEKTIIEMSSLMYENLSNRKRDRLVEFVKALTSKSIGINKNDLTPTYI